MKKSVDKQELMWYIIQALRKNGVQRTLKIKQRLIEKTLED